MKLQQCVLVALLILRVARNTAAAIELLSHLACKSHNVYFNIAAVVNF